MNENKDLNNDRIFFVYTFKEKWLRKGKKPNIEDVVGIYTNFDNARRDVERNLFDICVDDVAIIEELEPGMYIHSVENRTYFKVDAKRSKFIEQKGLELESLGEEVLGWMPLFIEVFTLEEVLGESDSKEVKGSNE